MNLWMDDQRRGSALCSPLTAHKPQEPEADPTVENPLRLSF